MVLKQLSMQAINPVLRRNNNDHLQVNIGIDVSEHSIIQYVLGEKSYIDILGYGISMTTKMTKLATMNSIALLHNSFKQTIFILFYLSDSYALKQVVQRCF